ncbi:sorbosone dehydrogenase family protein [Paenibacillus sp. NEAU-GSW1]|uniref:PQQ-dependent sugar dehydrogenase n=1 Tax=Paenibacillus sp. NEAU-GSW1 TaxID=2682486 RepID=UPI0012E28445|nr:PQQ-dependent sugar dehydrogenase [Paenibacillus sp. NEAU-GSW1]MUT65269.1 quinoprotein glucose dehydrogenase [Paenibacillus sp. NEAU-GSW1]
MKTKTVVLLLLLALSTAGLMACEGKEAAAPMESGSSGGSEYKVRAKKLQAPWAIAFDNDTIYISERGGNMVQLIGDQMNREPVRLNKPLLAEGEGGLLGLALAPDFSKSNVAYVYHTYEENGEVLNRIVTVEHKNKEWIETKALLEGIPGYFNHNGGRIAIGPDVKLYVTTGDSGQEQRAQQLDNLAGKILRMNLDGSIPADNPFPDSYIYSYGHRNPQGLAWDENGQLYSTEHGPSGDPGGHDEINRIAAGGNYGWPDIIGDAQKEGMIVPLYHTGEDTVAPSGAAFNGSGKLLVAGLRGQGLFRYDLQSDILEKLVSDLGRIRDVKSRDGKWYVLTNNTDGRGTPSEEDDILIELDARSY